MKKAELVAQLEAAKALTSVVSIDNIVALIQQLEAEVEIRLVESKTFLLNEESFDKVMNIVDRAVNNLDSRDIVDFDDAEFELSYNNVVQLTDVRIDTDRIIDEIRESMLNIFEETANDDEEGTSTDIPIEFQ